MFTNAVKPDRAGYGHRGLRKAGVGLLGLALLGTAACGDGGEATGPETPPAPGAIAVTVETAGFLKDDSYTLMLDGAVQGNVEASDAVTLAELDPGTYTVSLDDVAGNCAADGEAAVSVTVASGETANVTLGVLCQAQDPIAYSIRASRDRPDLEAQVLVECTFGLCPTEENWDFWVQFDSQSDPQSKIRQNLTTAVEVAHVNGKGLGDLTEADVAAATFSAELVDEPFGPAGVVLVRTDQGNLYALGNPVESTLMLTLDFEAVLLERVPTT